MRSTTVWTLFVQILFVAITGQSLAVFPPKPAPSVIPTALQRQSGEMRWRRTKPSEVLENWRGLAAKHQIPHGDPYLQGYEDDLDVLVNALKKSDKSDKSDKDRPHPCRAIWRRKRARRPPRGQTEEIGMLRGGANTSRQAQVETSRLGAASSVMTNENAAKRVLAFLQCNGVENIMAFNICWPR